MHVTLLQVQGFHDKQHHVLLLIYVKKMVQNYLFKFFQNFQVATGLFFLTFFKILDTPYFVK